MLLIGGLLTTAQAQSADRKAELTPGVRIAIVGDSITEQKLYSRFIESYLVAAHPELKARVTQFGWGGETAGGFLGRMDNDLMPFKPDIVTLCYGMNDGGYAPFNAGTGERYRKPLAEIVKKAKAAGATVIVGSPGAVDTYFFRRNAAHPEMKSDAAAMYNTTLGQLRDIAKSIATDAQMPFANVHDTMKDAMVQAHEKLGSNYHVCGGDGFHPSANGQLLMAIAFLKSMAIDGNLGTITIDMTADATAEGGHKVVSAKTGVVELESTRYPFAFSGDGKSPDSTRSIVGFTSFNNDFNRLTLKVKNAKSDPVSVTWGKETKMFPKADLEKGINLAAEFVNHPLAEPFRKVDAAVADQQNFQTMMIKQVITTHRNMTSLAKADPELGTALNTVRDRLWATDTAKQTAIQALVVPVKHTIVVK